MRSFGLAELVWIVALVLLPLQATEQTSCPRGDLSAQFCDRDGDMLADAESNPNKWLDPYELVFGYTENQTLHDDAKKALARHIEKATGKKVRFFLYRTNAAQLEAMRNGLLHIVALNTGSVPVGVECSGFRLFAMAAKADRSYGYTMMLISYPGSGITRIEDARDKTILFVTPTSNSGYKAPHVLLQSEYAMQEGIDYKARFSGSHTKSILRVANKQAPIAAIANGVLNSMIAKGKIDKNAITILYRSESFPGTGYGYPYNLKPSLARKIEQAFYNFRWRDINGTLREVNKYHDALFIPAQYKEKWKLVRTIDRSNRPAHTCR
jgi:phosphonate transport system substrate-binding protein